MEIKGLIRSFILENFMHGKAEDELHDADSLLDKRIIDSTGILELVQFIEEEFEITVEDEELLPENLDSVEKLLKFVSTKIVGAKIC